MARCICFDCESLHWRGKNKGSTSPTWKRVSSGHVAVKWRAEKYDDRPWVRRCCNYSSLALAVAFKFFSLLLFLTWTLQHRLSAGKRTVNCGSTSRTHIALGCNSNIHRRQRTIEGAAATEDANHGITTTRRAGRLSDRSRRGEKNNMNASNRAMRCVVGKRH